MVVIYLDSRVTSHKFLGVMIDETLKFDVHMNEVCTNILQPVLSDKLPLPDNVLLNLYCALIY